MFGPLHAQLACSCVEHGCAALAMRRPPHPYPYPPSPHAAARFFLELLRQRLSAADCTAAGWVLDGFPHTRRQAAQLAAAGFVPDKAVLLEAPHALLTERIRRGGRPVPTDSWPLRALAPGAHRRALPQAPKPGRFSPASRAPAKCCPPPCTPLQAPAGGLYNGAHVPLAPRGAAHARCAAHRWRRRSSGSCRGGRRGSRRGCGMAERACEAPQVRWQCGQGHAGSAAGKGATFGGAIPQPTLRTGPSWVRCACGVAGPLPVCSLPPAANVHTPVCARRNSAAGAA